MESVFSSGFNVMVHFLFFILKFLYVVGHYVLGFVFDLLFDCEKLNAVNLLQHLSCIISEK